MNKIQQGDVTLERIDCLPNEAKLLMTKKCILAHGESGHSHVIDSPSAKLFESHGNIYLDLQESTELLHEEHGKIELDPGVWQIGQVKEYDYFSKMARKVMD